MSESPDRNTDRIEALKKLLQEDPRSLAFVTLAEEHNRVGQHDEAADVAQRGLLSHPDSVAGRLALAVAEAERDNVREALEQIKRALIIDQENPKALALMGSILLKRGLAKRAVQFLTHAVKLDPKEPEYKKLLDEARRQAKGGAAPAEMPVFSGDNVPGDSPWGEESVDEAQAPEAEHTVFDPDALKKLRKKDEAKKLDSALRDLPGEIDEDAEPTKFHDGQAPLRTPRRVGELDAPDPREEPTAYATKNPLQEKPKMGGSAAEYSQMMKKADADKVRAEAEQRVRSNPPPSGPAATDDLDLPPSVPRTTSDRPKGSAPEKAPSKPRDVPKAPSVKREAAKAPSNAAPAEAAPTKPPSEAKPKPASAPKKPASTPKAASTPKREVPANKQVGPASTRMVDDALWALFGQKSPVGESAPPADAEATEDAPKEKKPASPKKKDAAEKPRAPVRAQIKGKKDDAKGGERAPGQMVVRTSERFGTWTRVAIVSVLAVAAMFTGYGIAVSSAGPGPEVASEELKGIATELEQGGLAALLAAEEQTTALVRANPDMKPLLSGALAEIYARRWQSFGRNDEIKKKAEQAVAEAPKKAPTVELITAMVELSTAGTDRKTLGLELDRTIAAYPQSPKAWVLKSRLAWMDGRKHAALESLYRAHAIHPQHRLTLLWLARWYADHGAYGTAFSYYDKVQERYPLDVQAAIERYVLGQITGADPSESQAVSTLAGLVREEIPQVAKDEAGRAALAFAVPLFADGELVQGLEELGKAEAAFEDSARFKAAVGGLFLAIGEFDRARKQYKRALELEPAVEAHRIGLARATFGEKLDERIDLVKESKRIKKANEKLDRKGSGVARLPYGTAKMVYGTFELVRVSFDPTLFPEDMYRDLSKKLDGGELQKALEAASLIAVGERWIETGRRDKAVGQFEESLSLYKLPEAHFGLGAAYLAKGAMAEAVRHLSKGLDEKPDDIASRLKLAEAHIEKGQLIDAINVLEKLEGKETISPEAMLMLGQLRTVRGDFEGALKPLETLAELQPQSPMSHLALGEVYVRLKRSKAAVDEYRKALEVDPKLVANGRQDALSPAALAYLGHVTHERKPKKGINLLKKSLEYEEAPIEAHFFLGRALLSGKRGRREGRRQLEKYIRLGPAGERKQEAERLLRKR